MYSIEHIKYIKKLKKHKMLIFVIQILIFIVFIGIWQFLANKNIINTFITSSPKKVIDTIYNLFINNNLFKNIWITIY